MSEDLESVESFRLRAREYIRDNFKPLEAAPSRGSSGRTGPTRRSWRRSSTSATSSGSSTTAASPVSACPSSTAAGASPPSTSVP